MENSNGQSSRPFPPRSSSRFAPGVYFNFEWGVALNANDRPTHIRGVNFTSRRMQDRFVRDEEERQRTQQTTREQPSQLTVPDLTFDHDLDWEYRDFQQERQRRHGVRPQEQHSRGSSAPPSFERDDVVSPLSPLSPEQSTRTRLHASTFPRETLDRPLPHTPASFRLGEDELPWSTPLWYRPSDGEPTSPPLSRTSPALQNARRYSASQTSIASKSSGQSRMSLMGGLPSLGYESTGRRERRSPRRRDVAPARTEDPQRERDLGELHSAMMGVDGLHNDGWESWTWNDGVGDLHSGSRSLGWAVRAEPAAPLGGNDMVGFYGQEWNYHAQQSAGAQMSPPPPYADSRWDFNGRGRQRPRSSGDGVPGGFMYWG